METLDDWYKASTKLVRNKSLILLEPLLFWKNPIRVLSFTNVTEPHDQNIMYVIRLSRVFKAQFRLEGGTRCGGSSAGRSCPSILTRMRCMASANSSSSRKPSLSMSDNFQILPSTEFGSFDFTISVFAAVGQNFS